MVAIRLSAVIGEDRKLVVQLPDDTPTGQVEVLIETKQLAPSVPISNPDRERVRAKLLAAGLLATPPEVPADAVPLTVEERMRIGTLPPHARSIDDIINEDREER